MLGFDQTITIYNRWYDKDAHMDLWPKTVIKNVSWAGNLGVSIKGTALASNHTFSVRIPTRAMPEGYTDKIAYQALESPNGHWTAQNGDIVMLGEGPDVTSPTTEIIGKYADVFKVTSVNTSNMTRLLPHLRIEGE
jgi:hypothetical protein